MQSPAPPPPPQKPTTKQTTEPTEEDFLARLPKTKFLRWVIALFAVFGAIRAFTDGLSYASDLINDTEPEITFAGDDKTPFSLPLRVTNRSKLFDIRHPVFTCVTDHVRTADFSSDGDKLTPAAPDTPIPSNGGSRTYSCGIKIPPGVPLLEGRIVPKLKYQTVWIGRTFQRRVFTWYPDADPPRWASSE